MSYQVLARKWRPQKFSELVGQQHVVDAITNALENNKLHHAYLFTGTRGVGKTTIARIFSKSLNCEQGQSANPCGKCDTCIDISDGRYVDLLEIDAASRTKVEDTRELLDNVQYRPTRGKYKVYLIDEVHMLSKHSFNALLKTLEEPPEHVKFLLATTDPQKLPVTILSRCLQFNLKALTKEQIQDHLTYILKQESIQFEDSALTQLAKAAQGSIRDSLSLTDQAIAQGNNMVTYPIVANMLGLLNKNHIIKLVKYICERDGVNSLEILDDICSQSPDYAQILSQILALLHQIALTQIVPDVCKLEGDSARGIYTLAKSISKEHLQVLYQIGVNGKRDLPHAPDAKSGLEMTILRMLAFSPAQAIPLDVDSLVTDSTHEIHLNEDSFKKPIQNETVITDKVVEKTSKLSTECDSNVQTSNAESGKKTQIENNNSQSHLIGETPSLSEKDIVDEVKTKEPADQEPLNQAPAIHELLNKEEDNKSINENIEGEPNESERINDLFHSETLPPVEEQSSEQQNVMQQSVDDAWDEENIQRNAVYDDRANDNDLPSNEDINYSGNMPTEKPPTQPTQSKSSYMRTLELLKAEKEIDEYTSEKDGDEGVKKSESVDQATRVVAIQTQFELGYEFDVFDKDIPAYLENGDKLVQASQIDLWSAFIDSTELQAYSRVMLLNTNCSKLSNPLKVTIKEENYNLCTEEVVSNIESKMSELFNQKFELEVIKGDTENTPYMLQQQIKWKRLAFAKHVVSSDTSIQELKKAFDADILEDSLEVRPKK